MTLNLMKNICFNVVLHSTLAGLWIVFVISHEFALKANHIQALPGFLGTSKH